jgi:hypothetical protein
LNLLVPVERIELPTFGLQNRCSTAELNRQLIENLLYRVCPLQPVADGLGRRQISELGGKGYWCENLLRTRSASHFQALAGLRRCRPPVCNQFSTITGYSWVMGIRPKHVEKAMRALRRRQPLLEAWLDALNRLDGPSCQIVRFRNTAQQRRPLMRSAERHRVSRHRSPHLLIVQTGPLPR